jgi:tetratricopeptide (TPR) repeat protein
LTPSEGGVHSRPMPRSLRFRAPVCWLLLVAIGWQPAAAASKDTWIEVRSPNFTVISNAGEKEARKIADQFEQFREVFHNSFPKLRVDLGKPLIIFAVKNEDSLKALLPAYWEVKGHAHPAGLYAPGEERHFVAVRTNTEGDNPYEVVYHEYTHAIMNLNFRGLPVWLGEGLAEFFGNSAIHDNNVQIGKIAPYHLRVLQQERLIPIDALLQADTNSPYYSEQNRVSVFYAESWTIVHYLMLDPEARKNQLLIKFLSAWDASGNQLEAAQKTFGNLRDFSRAMEQYARQPTFYVGNVKTSIRGEPKSYASRVLPPAEVDAERALFYVHTQRPKEATAAVDEALRTDANLPLAHEAQGLLAYSQQQFVVAEEAFGRAIELNTSSYFPYYFAAEAQLRHGVPAPQEATKLIGYLEKTIQMNPQFAPAHAALSSIYSINPETREKAFLEGRKAIELEPGNLAYATSYAYVLVNAGKTSAAKTLAARIQEAAKTPSERGNVQLLLQAIASREEYERQVAAMTQQAASAQQGQQNVTVVTAGRTVDVAAGGDAAGSSSDSKKAAPVTPPAATHPPGQEYAVEGNIASADCAGGPGKVILSVGKTVMKFRFSDFASLQVVASTKQKSDEPPACGTWKGQRVRLYFYKLKDKEYMGELDTIQFF